MDENVKQPLQKAGKIAIFQICVADRSLFRSIMPNKFGQI